MIDLARSLDRELSILRGTRRIHAVGRVKRFDGQIVHASAFPAAVGNECRIECGDGKWAEAEVIGFLDEYTVLVLTGGGASLVNLPKDPNGLANVVYGGRNAMPPFRGILTPEQIRDVFGYVNQKLLNAGPAAKPRAASTK
jgi:hypothetical protein